MLIDRCAVLGRMRNRSVYLFSLAPLWLWRSGEIDKGVGGGKERLARRMGVSREDLVKRLEWLEGYGAFWQ